MSELTDADREALIEWVFIYTEAEVVSDPDFRTVERIVREHVMRARADERERITLAWQWKDWPLLTKYVKAGSVIGAAQAVTDWLRAQNGGSDESQ